MNTKQKFKELIFICPNCKGNRLSETWVNCKIWNEITKHYFFSLANQDHFQHYAIIQRRHCEDCGKSQLREIKANEKIDFSKSYVHTRPEPVGDAPSSRDLADKKDKN